MIEVLNVLVSIGILTVMSIFVYLGAVVSEEHKQKRRIPLIWEADHPWLIKVNKFFNKNNVKDDV